MSEIEGHCPGTIVHELPPGPENPRNSEGSFLELSNGSILFAYSRFRGDQGRDDAPSDIAAIVSEDGGHRWRDGGVQIAASEHQTHNIMSVTLMRMGGGDVGLFYLVRASENDLRYYLRRSSDEGSSWGAAIRCIEPPGYYVVNNDRTVRLETGRIIVPAAFHRNGLQSRDRKGAVRFDSRAVDVFFLSDDDGDTWREAQGKCTLPYGRTSRSGLQEPGVLELSSGVLWAWARTDLCVQYEMFSFDRGESWTAPEPSRFTAPTSPLSAKRMPGGGIVAVWNPVPNYNGRSQFVRGAWTGGRTPLVMAVSADDGRSWTEQIVLDDDTDRGYCYAAMHFTETDLLLAYCAGGVEDGGCLNRLRIRSVPLEVLSAAADRV